ncbi:MAG TPA: helix-turn-helix transcriptional regulator [Erysipelothrix sp.]|nr:helix-turn-helix transcriptional regulator [Erysipelothrix sp.]
MMILIRLDRVMVDRRMSLRRLSQEVGISEVNLSRIKNERVKSIRLDTLNKLCKALDCQPRDLLEFKWDLDEWEEEKLL